jgi:TP901 family phage tail tape measure protein
MALATRNLYLVLKARDEASRVIRGFGRELSITNALAQAEQKRNLANQAQLEAARLRSIGASQAQIDAQNMLSRSLRNEAQELERNHRSMIRVTNALQSMSSTFITVGSGFAIAGAAGIAALFMTIKVAKEYQRQVALTMTQVDGFSTSLQELADVGINVARKIAVPFEEIQPALYDIFSSTSAGVKQATILLEGFAKTAVAGQVSLRDASRGTIPILNAFNIPLEKVNEILDIQFQLVRKGVGTYGEFSKVFGRVVPSATRAGQTFQTVAAMLAYLTRNGLSAAMAATSSARALDAMSHPKAVAAMEALGIKVRDVAGNFLPLEQSLSNLRNYLLKFPASKRVAELVGIFKGAGGTQQARRFLEQVLLRPGELEEYKGFLKDMNNANGAFATAYGIMSDTVEAKTVLLRNAFKVMEEFIGRTVAPIFVVIIGAIAKLVDWFNNLNPATKQWIVYAVMLGSSLTLVAGLILIVLGALAGLTAAIISAGASFFIIVGAIAGVVAAFVGLGAAIIIAYQKSQGFRDFIAKLGRGFRALWTDFIVPAAKGIYQAYQKYLEPAFSRLWAVIRDDVIPAVSSFFDNLWSKVLPALKEVAAFIKSVATVVFRALAYIIDNYVSPAIKELTKWYKEHKTQVDTVVTALVWLVKWAVKIGIVVLGIAAILAGGIIAGAILLFVKGITLIGTVILFVIDVIKNIINWFAHLGDHLLITSNLISTRWNGIIGFLNTIPGRIGAIFSTAGAWLVRAGRNILGGLLNGLGSVLRGVTNFFGGLGQRFLNALHIDQFYRMGRNVMNLFAAGLRDGGSAVGAAAGKAAQQVAQYLPHSPAKKGPLSGAGDPFKSGQAIIKRLAAGMKSVRLGSPMADAAHAASKDLFMRSPSVRAGGVVQNITVNTQEINPVRQSAELGFLLAGRSV